MSDMFFRETTICNCLKNGICFIVLCKHGGKIETGSRKKRFSLSEAWEEGFPII